MITAILIGTFLAPLGDTTVIVAGAELELVYVEPGAFLRDMESGRSQRVEVTSAFWMGRHEVTWRLWESVMDWNDGRGQPNHPVRNVTWLQIADFLERSSARVEGWEFRLPTEAEWEFAARAGGASPWTEGVDSLSLTQYAWIRSNAGGVVQEVGRRLPNAWGLHDMHGNVWEWVADWMAPYPDLPVVVDPLGPSAGSERVRRGGSAVYGADAARSSHRYQQPPDRGNGNLGFRVVAIPTRRAS